MKFKMANEIDLTKCIFANIRARDEVEEATEHSRSVVREAVNSRFKYSDAHNTTVWHKSVILSSQARRKFRAYSRNTRRMRNKWNQPRVRGKREANLSSLIETSAFSVKS